MLHERLRRRKGRRPQFSALGAPHTSPPPPPPAQASRARLLHGVGARRVARLHEAEQLDERPAHGDAVARDDLRAAVR